VESELSRILQGGKLSVARSKDGLFVRRSLASLLFVWASAASCQAGTIAYSFVGTTESDYPPIENESFQYSSPSFVLSETFVLATQLDCPNCISSFVPVVFYPDNCGYANSQPVNCADSIQFDDNNTNTAYIFYFPVGAFDSPGTYDTVLFGGQIEGVNENFGKLTVTETPEPATTWTMLTGALLAFVYSIRSRLRCLN
jgi:hypothetical protein